MSDPDPTVSPTPNSTENDPHADKVHDPRVKITARGLGLLALVLVGGVVMALFSVWARRTQLAETRRFWGGDGVTALQLGDQVTLIARGAPESAGVDLSGMPGLGHLRRALLDERHYDWTSQTEDAVDDLCGFAAEPLPAAGGKTDVKSSQVNCVQLRFADPTLRRVPELRIDIELESGTVGPADGSRRVRVNDRVRPALRHQINLLMNFHRKRYDERS